MSDLQNLTKELLKDKEFKKEFEKLKAERELILAFKEQGKEDGLGSK
ncbi:hypothetical protein [Oribacterium sinus]|jgi:hypothetical protein|nr:hypothetical protein [Oribacterium sinus]